jgi:hypothetical protein
VCGILRGIDDYVRDFASGQSLLPGRKTPLFGNVMIGRELFATFRLGFSHGDKAQFLRIFKREPAVGVGAPVSGTKK